MSDIHGTREELVAMIVAQQDENWRLRATLLRIAGRTRGSEIARIAEAAISGESVENAKVGENAQ